MAEMVTIVQALPGWDVLYYRGGGAFETASIAAWAITYDTETGEPHRVDPVTADASCPLDQPMCTPEGGVVLGAEHWNTVYLWADDMRSREIEKPDLASGRVTTLEKYRDKFQKGGSK